MSFLMRMLSTKSFGIIQYTGKFLQSSKVLEANLSPTHHQSQKNQHFYPPLLGDRVYIELDETEIDLSKVTSKLLYNKFKTKNQTPPSAQKKDDEQISRTCS